MEQPPPAAPRDGLSNIFKNLAWLIGGKGFGAICSLVYLAILARTLGLKDFGHFSLVFGTAQALVAVAGFQTWQTMVRFGAPSVLTRDWPHFGRLSWLCGAFDAGGAVAGCMIAAVVFYGFGHTLGISPKYVDTGFAFCCAMMWARMTTPNGIVRVLDRFDVGSYVEAVVPLGRLIGSLVIILVGATVGRFLFVWAFFDLLSAALYWLAAWKLVPEALRLMHFGHWKLTMRENPGLAKFFGVTYGASTLDAFYKQGPLLAVGYFLGTSAAGLYRFADQLAQGISRFSQLIARAVFPEFALAHVAHEAHAFRKLVWQGTLMAGVGGLVVPVTALLFGKPVLELMGGDPFVRAAPVLLPLAIGAAFELASVTYEPVLYSTGHATYPLIARALSVAALIGGTLAFVGYGPVGVAWAVALGLVIGYVAMTAIVWLVLRRFAGAPRPA
ncbi:MAG: lipopolysaccharide biosynthesis protein [Tsuneonella sp.]